MNKISPPLPSIRQAKSHDLIQILRIQTDSLRTICIDNYSPLEIEALIDRNLQHFSYGGFYREFILVAEVDNVIVGWSSLLGPRISGLYVHPQFVRQGIGTQLLQALETKAISCKHRTLKVAASLTAKTFYQNHGYQILDRAYIVTKNYLKIPYLSLEKQLLPTLC